MVCLFVKVKYNKRPELCRKVERDKDGDTSRRKRTNKVLKRTQSLHLKEGSGESPGPTQNPDLHVKG